MKGTIMGLSKKQVEILDRLFSGEYEDAILEDEGISRSVFRRWNKEAAWREEIEWRKEDSIRRSTIVIAGIREIAARKLIQLMDCDK